MASSRIRRPTAQGFTLVELCITTTVVGILTALGVASWRGTVLRAHRAEARVALLRIQAMQELQYVNTLRYTDQLDTTTTDGGRYVLQISTSDDGQHYTARAMPMPGSTQAADAACAELSLTETGRLGGTSPECWP